MLEAPHPATLVVGGGVGEVPAATLVVGGGVPRSAPDLSRGADLNGLGALNAAAERGQQPNIVGDILRLAACGSVA
jgi:hypothetical protein